MKKYVYLLGFLISCSNYLYSNTPNDVECLQVFNAYVYNKLLELNNKNIDVSSENITLIFEVNFSEDGNINSVVLAKSNLKCFDIDEVKLINSLMNQKMTCFRAVYYKGSIMPNDIVIVYNTKMLE